MKDGGRKIAGSFLGLPARIRSFGKSNAWKGGTCPVAGHLMHSTRHPPNQRIQQVRGRVGEFTSEMAINYVLLVSRQGKVRLAKWFTTLNPKTKLKIVKDVTQLVLARRTRMCNFLEYKGGSSEAFSLVVLKGERRMDGLILGADVRHHRSQTRKSSIADMPLYSSLPGSRHRTTSLSL